MAVDALVLPPVLDYKRHLQAIDPATGRPRAPTATIVKQLSALRGFARWLALDGELALGSHTTLVTWDKGLAGAAVQAGCAVAPAIGAA